MRSLESQANDEFLFVSNQVTLSAIDEVESQISSFGITKKVANLGSIPINLPPSRKQLRRIPSSATPSKALSPPLPPELVDLLPMSFRNNSIGEGGTEFDAPNLRLLSTECIDNSTFRASTGSSNYDYINDDAPPDSALPPTMLCLDDATHVNKSDTVKSDSSISTTTSTMSSSSSLFNGNENGMEVNLKNAVHKAPCVNNSSLQVKIICKSGNSSANSNATSSKKLRSVTNADINCSSSWMESQTQVQDKGGSHFLKSRENGYNYQQVKNQLCYDPLMKAYLSTITSQRQHRNQVSTNYLENASQEKCLAQNKYSKLTNVDSGDKKTETFKLSTDDEHSNYEGIIHCPTALSGRKVASSAFLKKASKQESDGIYDNFQVVRNEETAKETHSPLPFRRKTHFPPFIAQSMQSILEAGKTESHLSFACETCSRQATNRGRSRSCERSRFSPPSSPFFGRRPASPWRIRSGNLPLVRILEGTLERPSDPCRAPVKGYQPHKNNYNPIHTNGECQDKMLDPKLNFGDQIHPFKTSPLYLKDNRFYSSVQIDKGKGKLKKSYTFYKCMKNWLMKSQ